MSESYKHVVKGGLKLKGGAGLPTAGGVKKKKKKKKDKELGEVRGPRRPPPPRAPTPPLPVATRAIARAARGVRRAVELLDALAVRAGRRGRRHAAVDDAPAVRKLAPSQQRASARRRRQQRSQAEARKDVGRSRRFVMSPVEAVCTDITTARLLPLE